MVTSGNIGKAKAVATLTCLLLASCILAAQSKPSTPAEDDGPNAPSRLFNWDPYHRGDFDIWLNKNKSLLDRSDVCDLNVAWSNRDAQYYGSVFNVATFLVVPAEEQVTYMIHHAESGLDIRVGVIYDDPKNKNPKIRKAPPIRIALAFEGAPEDVFTEDSRAEAETIRVKDWRYIRVGKEIKIGPVRYHFTLACSDFKHSVAGMLMRVGKKHAR